MNKVIFENVKSNDNTVRESFRNLRTNIRFCGDDVKTIMITSTTPDEGKSSVSFELARSFAELGKKVLLIDGDMRKSNFIHRLGAHLENEGDINGLSHFLAGESDLDNSIYESSIENLNIMFAGAIVSNSTEVLERSSFKELINNSKNNYDYVIVDSAPLEAAVDSAIISRAVDGVVLVVSQNVNGSRFINRAVQQLRTANARILGVVINKFKVEGTRYGYGSYYGKRYYGKYYGSYYGKKLEKKGANV